jgi:predicted phage-related endonuclease
MASSQVRKKGGSMTAQIVPCTDRASWLQARLQGIGGSEACIVLGLTKKSWLELWGEKLQLIEPDSFEDLEYIKWGNILEDPIAQEVSARTGRRIIDHGRFAIAFSEKYTFMHCTIDREMPYPGLYVDAVPNVLMPPGFGPGSLSIKSAGEYRREDWDEGPPLWAQVQVQHELIVHDWQWGTIAALIGGNKLRFYDVVRNENFCATLIEREREFWQYVIEQKQPPPDASESTRAALGKMHPRDDGSIIDLPLDSYEWADLLRKAKEDEKEAQVRAQAAKNLIIYHIGKASVGLLPDVQHLSDDQLAEMRPELKQAIERAPSNIIAFSYRGQSSRSREIVRVLREEKSRPMPDTTFKKWRVKQ